VSTTSGRRRPGRPPKTEAGDTRAALLDAALLLFSRHGYAGTSIRAIAREVGLSESVLYAHFDGKRAIYEAAMALVGPGAATLALTETPVEPAEPAAWVRAYTARLLEQWDTPQARQAASFVARDGLLHDEMLGAGIETALAQLAAVFERWMQDGLVRDDLGGPDAMAFAVLAPIAQARMLWLHADATDAERDTARRRVTAHGEMFARLLHRSRSAELPTTATSPARSVRR
jgi:AcrR family transcriptional regulator